MNKLITLLTALIYQASGQPIDQSKLVASALVNAAGNHGVPISIMFSVAYTESRFKCSAVGSSGEIGLMQINPKAWRLNFPKELLFNCFFNAEAGASILERLYKQTGSWAEAVKRYNGSGKMAKRYLQKVAKTSEEFFGRSLE